MYKNQLKKMLIGAVLSSLLLAGCGEKEQYYHKAQQYLSKDEYSLAIENYNKAIMEDEQLQQSYRGAGIAYMKMADYEKAEEMFLRALKASDGTIGDMELDLSYYLGETQICLGKYEEAIETYTNVLEVYEDEIDARFYRGSAYLSIDNLKKAEEDFKKAVEKGDMMLLYGIYEAYEAKGSDTGHAYLEKIIEKKGDSAEELYVKGKAYYKMGDVEQAIKTLKKSAKKEEWQALFYMGYVYEQQGDYETAIQNYNSYKEKVGLTFGEYTTVAECMLKAGKYEAALELNQYMRESAGKSELQDLKFEEIVIYEKSGDYSTARNKAEAYVMEYPEDAEGQKEYQFLLTR